MAAVTRISGLAGYELSARKTVSQDNKAKNDRAGCLVLFHGFQDGYASSDMCAYSTYKGINKVNIWSMTE